MPLLPPGGENAEALGGEPAEDMLRGAKGGAEGKARVAIDGELLYGGEDDRDAIDKEDENDSPPLIGMLIADDMLSLLPCVPLLPPTIVRG